MANREFSTLIHEMYRRSEGHAPTPDFLSRLQECLEDNGLQDERRVPIWLIEALEAALDGRELREAAIGRLDGDVANFLSEASDIVPGWSHVDEGEWLQLVFTALGTQLYISREGIDAEGKACDNYALQKISDETP